MRSYGKYLFQIYRFTYFFVEFLVNKIFFTMKPHNTKNGIVWGIHIQFFFYCFAKLHFIFTNFLLQKLFSP